MADKQWIAALFIPDEDVWHERPGREFATYPAHPKLLVYKQLAWVWVSRRPYYVAPTGPPRPRRWRSLLG